MVPPKSAAPLPQLSDLDFPFKCHLPSCSRINMGFKVQRPPSGKEAHLLHPTNLELPQILKASMACSPNDSDKPSPDSSDPPSDPHTPKSDP